MMLGVFAKTTRRKRGDKSYEYLSLVEAVRDGGKVGHRTLLRLGEVTALRDSGQLDRIIAALRAHAERPWAALDEATLESARSAGTAACRTRWPTRCSPWSPTASPTPARSGAFPSGWPRRWPCPPASWSPP